MESQDADEVVRKYWGWCVTRPRDTRFRGLDRDDVVSEAAVAIWTAFEWMTAHGLPLEDLLRVATRRLIQRTQDMRSRPMKMRRHPGHGLRILDWPRDDDDAFMDIVDPRARQPLDILIDREERKAANGRAEPCAKCGTTAGVRRSGRDKPERIRGLCHACYNRGRYIPRKGI